MVFIQPTTGILNEIATNRISNTRVFLKTGRVELADDVNVYAADAEGTLEI